MCVYKRVILLNEKGKSLNDFRNNCINISYIFYRTDAYRLIHVIWRSRFRRLTDCCQLEGNYSQTLITISVQKHFFFKSAIKKQLRNSFILCKTWPVRMLCVNLFINSEGDYAPSVFRFRIILYLNFIIYYLYGAF